MICCTVRHVTEFCKLVCVLVVLTKVSHACGWHFVPADWAGCATLRFMVDIITLGIARNSSDWLHTVQGFVCYTTRIRRNQPSWLVRSLHVTEIWQTGRSPCCWLRYPILVADILHFLPAIGAGFTKLKFMVDIIIFGMACKDSETSTDGWLGACGAITIPQTWLVRFQSIYTAPSILILIWFFFFFFFFFFESILFMESL